MLQFNSFKDYAQQYQAMPRQNAPLAPAPSKKVVVPRSASCDDGVRKTIAEFDFSNKVIKLMKLNPVYVEDPAQFKTIDEMYSVIWNRVLRSPKLRGVTFKVSFYGQRVKAMIQYCEMMNLAIDIITPQGKFHTSREYQAWYQEQCTAQEEHLASVENVQLMIKHAPELLKYAKISSDELIRVLREQIRLAGYDVDMQSVFTTDGLNSGIVEDGKGRREWSRSYTKHYERYDRTLKDLLMMYISCKFYRSAGYEETMNRYGISESDIDSYTGDVITEPIQINLHADEDVVVPRSACGLGVQNLMN